MSLPHRPSPGASHARRQRPFPLRPTLSVAGLLAALLTPSLPAATPPATSSATWSVYGADLAGTRYSPATDINRTNVQFLQPAWTTRTGALDDHRPWQARAAFEATPILFVGTLYLTTQFDQVLALDPATGAERWRFDPHVGDPERGIITSRGVSAWPATPALNTSPEPCATRIFLGTLDARLLALDAASGQPCRDFGDAGAVDLRSGMGGGPADEYEVTSAPTVVGDIVVTGSSIGDNHSVDEPRGTVRAFDARSGRELWRWNPLPWAEAALLRTGGGNAWSTIAADPEHGILYVPTSSPSPDFFGGFRSGEDRDADSLVALDVHTGGKLWAFQIIHHNLWDYDLAAEPLLFTFRDAIPAVAIVTKLGTVFVLNRLTGQPLFPVTERPVPQTNVPGEHTSPTQPFSALPPLVPQNLPTEAIWGPTPADQQFCRDKIARLRSAGVFTPPSTQGSLQYPGSLGGVNWGSVAFNPATGVLYANTNRQPFLIRLGPARECWWHDTVTLPLSSWLNGLRPGWLGSTRAFRWLLARFYPDEAFQPDPKVKISNPHFGEEYSPMAHTPYTLVREPLTSPSGLPCSPPPWGTLNALDLNRGQLLWQVPLGSMDGKATHGSIGLGGPITTAGDLVFTAAARDPHLRAFDSTTGQLLWTGGLPVPAQATPMTYLWQGTQYLVIAAGGHGSFGTPQGDYVVAFRLPSRSSSAKLNDWRRNHGGGGEHRPSSAGDGNRSSADDPQSSIHSGAAGQTGRTSRF